MAPPLVVVGANLSAYDQRVQSSDLPLGSAITPNLDQFQALAAAPDEGPAVMLNLLKFKPGGEESYLRYGDTAKEMIQQRGGRLLWSGRADQVLIGDPAVDWDVVLLVEYPSRSAFIEMVSSPEYLEAHADREAALERTVVLACTPGTP
jgi:uncharacterized protein (DUF1330 family)